MVIHPSRWSRTQVGPPLPYPSASTHFRKNLHRQEVSIGRYAERHETYRTTLPPIE